MRVETETKMKRWREQRWLLDQVIQTRGLDWDQGRTGKILRNCGPGVQGDLQEISRRVQKFVDIPREFARAAVRQEAAGIERPQVRVQRLDALDRAQQHDGALAARQRQVEHARQHILEAAARQVIEPDLGHFS